MVVHIAASLYITSLPNHLQETVGKKDYFKKKTNIVRYITILSDADVIFFDFEI